MTENNVSGKIKEGLIACFGQNKPIIVCVGTDITIGDCLGPIVGTMLSKRGIDAFIYGKLSATVTAKEVAPIKEFIAKTHPNAKTLVIDAAIGEKEDLWTIKLSPSAIRPGLGANKLLPALGNANVIGIVAEKSSANYSFMNLTRLSPVYEMAKTIADGVTGYFEYLKEEYSAHRRDIYI